MKKGPRRALLRLKAAVRARGARVPDGVHPQAACFAIRLFDVERTAERPEAGSDVIRIP